MEYYQRIKNMREDLDIKQYVFARSINVLPKTYNLYENGLREIPYHVLSRILHELRLSLDYILGLSQTKFYPHSTDIDEDLLGKNLKWVRRQMGLSQAMMANIFNCKQQTLSGYERGELKVPIEVLKKAAQISGISADTISGRIKEVQVIQKIPNR